MPATYHFDSHRRGDTFQAKAIATLTDTDTGDAIAVTSARLQVRQRINNALVHEWDSTAGTPTMMISGAGSNIITMAEVANTVTALWATGAHRQDLEVTLTTGETLTLLAGDFPVVADITL